MTADLGADRGDLTIYWLPDTSNQTLFALKTIGLPVRRKPLHHWRACAHGSAHT